jgi:hypothetical protein
MSPSAGDNPVGGFALAYQSSKRQSEFIFSGVDMREDSIRKTGVVWLPIMNVRCSGVGFFGSEGDGVGWEKTRVFSFQF